MTVAIVGSAVLAQYAPHPMRTPYAIVAVICTVLVVGVVALREPHQARTRASDWGAATADIARAARDRRGMAPAD